MKLLIIAVLLIVGGVHVGVKAFDYGVASVEQTETAKAIKARQVL